MIAILYTNTDAIRSSIGVDENDVSDTMITNQNLDLQMLERLSEVMPNYESVYEGSEEGERKVTLWCQYFGALTLLENAALAIPQKIQANNDQLVRYQVNFEAIKVSLRDKLKTLEKKINPPVASTAHSVMGISFAGYNPVTGV
jgi:hypothetical protein